MAKRNGLHYKQGLSEVINMIKEIKGFDHTDEFQWVKKMDKGHYKIIDGKSWHRK